MTCRRRQSLRKRIARLVDDHAPAFVCGVLVAMVAGPWILGASVALSFVMALLWGWLT